VETNKIIITDCELFTLFVSLRFFLWKEKTIYSF